MRSDSPVAWTVGALVTLAVVVGVGQALAVRGRVYLPEQRSHVVATAADAYRALRADGVEGRVLVLLGDRSRIVPRTWMATFIASLSDPSIEPPVMEHNLTSTLVYSGVVREVYFAPPDGAWDVELARVTNRPDSMPEGNGARARFYGVPVHVTRTADLPVFGEKVIVFIADGAEERYDPAFIDRITSPEVADVVVRQDRR